MPRVPRRAWLLAGFSLLLLVAPLSSAQSPVRAKSPGPQSLSFAVDPAQLAPAQRLKLQQAGATAAPAAATALSPSPARSLGDRAPGPAAAPVAISPSERAALAERSQAKLEIYQRGPSPRPNVGPGAVTRPGAGKPAPGRPRVAPDATNGPPGLTPGERAKAAAAGLRVPASDGVRR